MKRLPLFLALILCLSVLVPSVLIAHAVSEEPSEITFEPNTSFPSDETHQPYINGGSDGFFHPNASLSRAELSQIVYSLGNYPDAESCSFPDIPENAWYARQVRALAAAGILKGYSDGTFRPKKPVTRAQFVAVLARLTDETYSDPTTFTDVSESFWGYSAISLAQCKGWVSGYSDGTFRPNKAVTRAEAVSMMNRFLGRIPDQQFIDQATNLRYFPDVRQENWYYYHVMEASVPHTAHLISAEDPEIWADYEPDTPHLADGFHCVNNRLYVVKNGLFVHTAGTGTVGGISYRCRGESGICTVSVPIVKTFSGTFVIIGSNGHPLAMPGKYEDGFYLFNGSVYAVMKGYVLNTQKKTELNGVPFYCSGEDGICTVYKRMLRLNNGQLVMIGLNGYPTGLPGKYKDGFYLCGGSIYAVVNGYVQNTEKTAKLNGVTYHCTGADGICTVSTQLLKLNDGTLILVNDSGYPNGQPGKYTNGYYLINGSIYAVLNGYVQNTEKTANLNGVTFHCTGADGICTVSTPILKLNSGILVLIADSGYPSGQPGKYTNGYYLLSGSLYAVMNGYVQNEKKNGVLNGITFHCSGASGVCTADTEVLKLCNGELIFLRGGKAIAAPGKYRNGFHVKAGHLYVVQNGLIRHTAGTAAYDGVTYTCEGDSGRCTTADWRLLYLPDIDISSFGNSLPANPSCSFSDVSSSASYYRAVAVQTTLGIMEGTDKTHFKPTSNVTYGQALRAAVKVYEFYFNVESMPNSENSNQYYAAKAIEYGILDKALSDYNLVAPRGDIAIYLCRAMHGRELEEVNSVNAIPDVRRDNPFFSWFMILYRAGITKGTGQNGAAQPNGNVQRKEMAELLTRLILPDERLQFTLYTKMNDTLQYGTSGSGKYPLNAYRLGDGDNVMVLSFALHGWEDNWDRDGQELVYLAEQTKQYLLDHYSQVENGNWTVYILSCLNPDGLYDGTTCNGPGRCTTTYYNDNGVLVTGSGKGIDMNRCFPYNYSSRTDARNFNGTAPLQCVEARALATFIPSIKGSGHNILIDTHGWFSQIIPSSGKGTVYQAFLKQFPSHSYAALSNGSGYFSAWAAFIQGYDSCLLELPKGISSHDSFVSSGSIGKFEAAISDLLQNYKTRGITRGPLPEDEFELDGN